MPFAEAFMISGVTTAAQTGTLPARININCGFIPTKVNIINATQFGVTGSGFENIQELEWNSNFPGSTFLKYINAAGTALVPNQVTVNGIAAYDGSNGPILGPIIAGTSISLANPAVVTTTAAHGLQTGDTVLITNTGTMPQIGGLYFTVTVTGATTFTIPINTTGGAFVAQGAGFTVRRQTVGPLYYPGYLTISNISQAQQMVVSTTTNHGLTVGQKVKLIVSPDQGMIQANGIRAVITAVTATTFTLGSVNSTAFNAWTWPVALDVPFSQSQVLPFGSGPSPVPVPPFWNQDNLDDAITNVAFQGFTIGTGLLQTSAAGTVGVTAGDVLIWTAWRADF